jgi:hypothetical protein
MNRALLTSHLATAERHVTSGELILTHQRGLTAQMERAGLDTSVAQDTLGSFERTQEIYVADSDRLRGLLDQRADPAI